MDINVNLVIAILAIAIVCIVVGSLMNMIKNVIILLLIVAVISGGLLTSQYSEDTLLTKYDVTYVKVVDQAQPIRVVPIFKNDTEFKDANVKDLMSGPKRVEVRYSTQKVLDSFMARNN